MKQIQSKTDKYKPKGDRYNIWFETVSEVAKFMGEEDKLGKWQSRCKGRKHYELEDMMKLCRAEGKPPQKLFNFLIKQ